MSKGKRKVIHVELRKESTSFDGWLKYEITIKDPDGSIEKVPAYGKDLQDALSRVVHDDKVKRMSSKFEKIPSIVWIVGWFAIMGYSTIVISSNSNSLGEWVGPIYVGIVALVTTLTISISNWFVLRNKRK
jgi:hypothetical protein